MPGTTPKTVDQLRNAIDHGRTGEKVAYPDPAAAPLGTDDEAAGKPATKAELKLARIEAPPAPRRRDETGLALYGVALAGVAVVTLGLVAFV